MLVSVLGAGLIACAAHGELWLGADSATPIAHGLGCGVPLMTAILVTSVSLVPLTEQLAAPPRPERPLRLPVSFFQPPERRA